MRKSLIGKLRCPNCKFDLKWEIFKEIENNIIEANIKCKGCGCDYAVIDGVANFTILKNNVDTSIYNNKSLANFFQQDDLVRELLETKNEQLNISDVYAKVEYYKLNREYDKIRDIYNNYDFDIYSKQSNKVLQDCFSKLQTLLWPKRNDFILDFASGNSIMGGYINKKIPFRNYIVNDISIENLMLCKYSGVYKSNIKNLDFFAFDLNNTPFKERSIDYAISFAGFQNMICFHLIIDVLKSMIRKKIYHISIFCDNNDKINMMVLRMQNMQFSWNKQIFLETVEKRGVKYREIYSDIAVLEPIPQGKVVRGYRMDKFPLVKTKIEFSLGEISIL